MLKIGDFSKLSRVSVKTLRYYDKIDLLKPAETDHFTGYRYYSMEQLPRLNRILALKDLGLTLEQISILLDQELPAAQLRGILRLKQIEIQERMGEELERLARVEVRLRQIEQENTMPDYEVILKTIEPIRIASIRDKIPSYPEQGHLWQELSDYLSRNRTEPEGPCLTLYHSEEPDIDAEVCEPIDSPLSAGERVKVYELPRVDTAACVIHHGPFVSISEAYSAVLKWIEMNNYRINGPCREVYLQTAVNGSQTDPNTITEIQFPVLKV